MTDIVEFLRARLDEDERVARAAQPSPWTYDRETFTVRGKHWEVAARRRSTYPGDLPRDSTPILDVDGTHIARHDPARVLADVEAHRRIVELCSGEVWADRGTISEPILRLLALPYAEHPGYRPEWAP